MAEPQSKIIISAEDRTRAAFAAIERNTGKATAALAGFQRIAFQLAGAGTIINFLRRGAESTEKWRDEMAKLDEVTKKYFQTAADAGKLDPLLKVTKGSQQAMLGAATAIDNLGIKIGANAVAFKQFFTGNFAGAAQTLKDVRRELLLNTAAFVKLNQEISTPAPAGYAKRLEEEAARIKEAARKMKEAEQERRKATLAAGKPAEDAFRGEAELSEGFTKEGLTALGEEAVNERLEAERELLRRESELRAEQREQDIAALLESQLTEKELTDAQYAQDLQTLYDARQAKYLTEVQFKQQLEQLELTHRAKMGDINAQAELARLKVDRLSWKERLDNAKAGFAMLVPLMQSKHKAIFEVGKAAAIAEIGLKIKSGAVKAYESMLGIPIIGPALGVAAAAAYVGFSLEQMAAIKGTNFGGGGDVGGGTPSFNVNPSTGLPVGTPGGNVGGLPVPEPERTPLQIVVNLDGQPILETVQRASSDGRIIINAHAVR